MVFGVASSLALIVGGAKALLGTILWFVAISYAPRRFRMRATMVLATPLVIIGSIPGGATLSYLAGTAAFHSAGLPPIDWTVDPVVRAPSVSEGCMPLTSGYGRALHNGTLHALGSVLGPMPGSYRGPIPDRAEAARLVASAGAPLDVTGLGSGELHLADGTYHVKTDTGRILPFTHAQRWSYVRAGPDTVLLAMRAEDATVTRILFVDLRHEQLVASYYAGL